jgi:two-component system OmpR family response regulator
VAFRDPSSSSLRLLLIEDDERLARFTSEYLAKHGLFVEIAANGETGLREALKPRYDIIVLDLMLPRLDGLSVCKHLRERSDVPILMVTARSDEADRVLGLELGADDYLTKPFSVRELLARVRALVRRHRGEAGPSTRPRTVGRLSVDPQLHRVTVDGVVIHLTAFEFRLLLALAERPGRVLSREVLLDLVKGSGEETFDRSVDSHICRLRQKLGDDPRRPSLLKTVRGMGYVLAAHEDG